MEVISRVSAYAGQNHELYVEAPMGAYPGHYGNQSTNDWPDHSKISPDGGVLAKVHEHFRATPTIWTVSVLLIKKLSHSYAILYNEKYFSERQFSYMVRVLTWRAQKMLQVQKAHDWSELQCCVHKQGWP